MNRFNLKLGVDVGGTFTDFVLLNIETGDIYIDKVLTTSTDPSRGIILGINRLLRAINLDAKEIESIIHGTTLIANTIIERKGAKTGLITTKGFRDILEIGREMRFDIYDLFAELPKPLVPRYLRREVPERVDANGNIVEPLDLEITKTVIKDLLHEKIETIAVSLLHSFRNPTHEKQIGDLIREIDPQLIISLSSEVVPEVKEYERTSTTVANSYVLLLFQHYLNKLIEELKNMGFLGNLFIMLSDGGITTIETALKFPIRIVESGPAGGAIAACKYGEITNQSNVISFDMGGTTAKICFIEDGRPHKIKQFEVARVYRFKKGSGIPLKIPAIELLEIGAGGGSIARVDKMGLLKVGPESAGAFPGPVCYDQGGIEPTITDADLVLGYLNPNFFLGGEIRLNIEKAKSVITEKIAKPMGISLLKAAWGIHEIVNENMADSARIYAMEKGIDLTKYTMVALGGAGPVHAYGVALKIKLRKIIYPPRGGVLSALGFLIAPISFELSRSFITTLNKLDINIINKIYQEMEIEGTKLIKQAGVLDKDITYTRSASARYIGQGYEIEIPIPERVLTQKDLIEIKNNFNKEYKRLYNRLNEDIEIELIDWRVLVSGPKPRINFRSKIEENSRNNNIIKEFRKAFFPEVENFLKVPVYDYYSLKPRHIFKGPAIFEQKETTIVIGPRGIIEIDNLGNLVVELEN